MSINKGDIVRVNDKLQISEEDEELFINEEAEVVAITSYTFPVEIRFKNPQVQKLNESLGTRMFDYFELTKI